MTALIAVSPAAAQQLTAPLVVPLNPLNVDSSPRLGISGSFVGSSGTVPEYLFDTGSAPLVSAYKPGAAWWGDFQTIDTNTSEITYGPPGPSQVSISYHTVATALTLTGGNSATLTSGTSFQVAQAYSRSVDNVPDDTWLDSLPPDQGVFYGTFGADLTNPAGGLYGYLNQFTPTGGMHSGFVVDATGPNPTLTIGLDAQTRSLFVDQFPINTVAGGGFAQHVVNASFQICRQGTTGPAVADVPTLFDTGTPFGAVISTGTTATGETWSIDPSFVIGGSTSGYLVPGLDLTFSLGGVTLTTQSGFGNIYVLSSSATAAAAVRFGIPFFSSYAVMYDVQGGTVGFLAAASVPEVDPAGLGAIIVFVTGMVGLIERRRFIRTSAVDSAAPLALTAR